LEHPYFHALLARNLLTPPPFLHAAIHRELAPNVEVFIAALRHSLPKVPEDLLHLRTMFAMGALLMFSMQMSKMSLPRDSRFVEGLLKEVVRFIASGLQSSPALAAAERPSFPRPPLPRSTKLPRR
jgi:hypothetical protein